MHMAGAQQGGGVYHLVVRGSGRCRPNISADDCAKRIAVYAAAEEDVSDDDHK